MTEPQTQQRRRGRKSKGIRTVRSWASDNDVDALITAMSDGTGIPVNTLVNSILRAYFTQRGAGSGIVMAITPEYNVQVPIQWPKVTPTESDSQ